MDHRKSIIMYHRIYTQYFLLITGMFAFHSLFGQEKRDEDLFSYEVRLGANINLYRGILGKERLGHNLFSGQTGLRLFVSGMINLKSKNWILAYGPTVGIYNKSLGNSQNPLENDIQIDLVNSFSAGVGYSRQGSMKYLRTLGNTSAYNLRHDFDHALILSGNYILNNHNRNQSVGCINITVADRFTLMYYNDGGPGIQNIGSGDNFDRWWTGGGGIFIHANKRDGYENFMNYAELTFDQFTGYSPLIYELSTILGSNIPNYEKLDDEVLDKFFTSKAYNSSAYNLKVAWPRIYPVALDIGLIGSLVEQKKGKKMIYGVQDLIHASMGFVLHPNRDDTRLFFGATYNARTYVK